MQRLCLVIFFIISCSFLFGYLEETASFRDFVYGETDECLYSNWASHISEGIAVDNYNLYAPWDEQNDDFGEYVIPSEDQLASWELIVWSLLAEQIDFAEETLQGTDFPYHIVSFHDEDADRDYYMLREDLNMDYVDDNGTESELDDEVGSFDYGWGLYVFNPSSNNQIIITAPHPNDDYITSAIAVECFQEWDARYLLISGAGREVRWNNVGNYTNSKSLSDPSRNEEHAFQSYYKVACDEIRSTFGKKELSFQIHSYDWNRHEDFATCQISAGYGNPHPDLPIRDLSSNGLDVIQASPFRIHEPFSVGENQLVTLNDFYGVYYNDEDFFYDNDGEDVLVSNNIDLTGYSQNRQMLYTLDDWNDYDTVDPFFHVEFDELPNSYRQVEEKFHDFYGYNVETEVFELENLYVKTLQYYRPFIDAVGAVLPSTLELDDDLPAPIPQNLNLATTSYSYVELQWDRVDCYDFNTYEILYATDPITDDNFEVVNREDVNTLASQQTVIGKVSGLEPNYTYYFRVRTHDINGNVSDLSEEVSYKTSSVSISNFKAIGNDGYIDVSWTAQFQYENSGFRIYRSNDPETGFVELVDYHSDDSLIGESENNVQYHYRDNDVVNNEYYYYKVASENLDFVENVYNSVKGASPYRIYKISLLEHFDDPCDSVFFGINPFTSDGFDSDYDIPDNSGVGGDYIIAKFYEPEWPNSRRRLEKEIHGDFDLTDNYKTWEFIVYSSDPGVDFEVSLDGLPEADESVILYYNDNYYDLWNETPTLTTISDTLKMDLIVGDFEPVIELITIPSQLYQVSDEIFLQWNAMYGDLVESLRLYAVTETETHLISDDLVAVDQAGTALINIEPLQEFWFMLEAETYSGTILQSYSYDLCSIFPDELDFIVDPGWSMVASPLYSFNSSVSNVYGIGSKLYEYIDGEYDRVMNVEDLVGYWLKTNNGNESSISGLVYQNKKSIPLDLGWNLVPNPHPIQYNVNQLVFSQGGQDFFNYPQMLEYQFTKPKIFSYDDTYYRTEIIEPGTSFWLYNSIPNIEITFKPYGVERETEYPEAEWEIELLASQEGISSDNIKLVHPTEDDSLYSFWYDIPKPPATPQDEQVRLSINKELIGTDLQEWFQYSIRELDTQLEDLIEIPFVIEVNAFDEIEFTFNSDMPDSYQKRLNIDGVDYFFQDDIVFFTPTDSVTFGNIIIMNEFVGNSDVNQVVKFSCQNYPNPFNKISSQSRGDEYVTKISYSLPENSEIELSIYNIKGQKVKLLEKGHKEKGIYEIGWDGTDNKQKEVASGVYFYKLSLKKGKSIVNKMLYLK